MAVSQATPDQKGKKEWDVASGKEAQPLSLFLAPRGDAKKKKKTVNRLRSILLPAASWRAQDALPRAT
jgi:hypothetical protein